MNGLPNDYDLAVTIVYEWQVSELRCFILLKLLVRIASTMYLLSYVKLHPLIK